MASPPGYPFCAIVGQDEMKEALLLCMVDPRIGGVMIISVPDCRSPLPPKSFDDFHNVLPLEHVNCFTPDTLRGFVERLGFQSLGRQPAHVTTKVSDLVKTEISRFYQPKTTSQYFRKVR